jgi:hypothetical protein
MNKKNTVVLILFLAVMGGLYYYLYKDSFHKNSIQIFHTFRPKRSAMFHRSENPDAPIINNLTFALEGDFRLTSVKVLSISELATNKYAHPLWELTTTSNSAPIRAFEYGQHIRGMHTAVKGATASALTPDVPYRLLVKAGSLSGEHDFTIKEENHLSQQ